MNFIAEEQTLNKLKQVVNDFLEHSCPNKKFREGDKDKYEDIVSVAIREICSECPLSKKVLMYAVETFSTEDCFIPLCQVLQIEFNENEE